MIFDKLLNSKKESESIIKIISDKDLFGRKIYFNELFYHSYDGYMDKNSEPIYTKRQIEYILVHDDNVENILYSIDGKIINTRIVDRQVVSIVYLKLQGYVREFEN